MATYETNNNNNNNNVYEDNSSEISKEISSSSSSFVDETKRISFVDSKEAKNLSSSKRNKRSSFISKFGIKKDDKEKEDKEKRSLSGIFSIKDKDNKRNSTVESADNARSTLRTPSNSSDTSKNRRSYIFTSEDEEKLEIDTNSKIGKKSRQSSNAEGLEKDKSSKKEKRLSVLGKFIGLHESKSSQKSKNDVWEDSFIGPDETKISSKTRSPPLKININSANNSNNTDDNLVESPKSLHHNNSIIGTGTDNVNKPFPPKIITDDSPVDDVQSTTSSSQSSDDQYSTNNKHESESPITPMTPTTPKANIMSNESESNISNYDNNTNMFQKLETLNKSLSDLSNAKEQLEAKVAEHNNQITRFNSVEQIMQQQNDLSQRMTEMMQRLELKSNVQKDDEFDVENTIRRLENKIDRQNDELIRLKSIVGQLTGENQPLLLTNGDISHQNLVITQQGEERALIQTNHSQSPQIYSRRTLVSTLVVSPLCNTITISASIATSVLYAVYVRPVVGLVNVLRDISTTKCKTSD